MGTDSEWERRHGVVEPLLFNPATPVYPLSEAELSRLPYKYLAFGSLARMPKEIQKFFYPEVLERERKTLATAATGTALEDPMVMYANFPVSERLQAKLRETLSFVRGQSSIYNTGEDSTKRLGQHLDRAWDSQVLEKLADLQRQCRIMFDKEEFANGTNDLFQTSRPLLAEHQ